MAQPRVFKSKWQRFARNEGIEDSALLDAVDRIEEGQIDANLGGGVLKQRIARLGEGGKSGGYRTIVLFRHGDGALFMFGFPKSQRDNIKANEAKAFKEAAKYILALTDKQLAELTGSGELVEGKRV